MKKGIPYVLIVCLLMGALSGCGGEYKTSSSGGEKSASVAAVTVSGQAINSQVVTGSAITLQEEHPEQYRFCSKTHLYYSDDEGKENFLVERSLLDSSERKIYINNFEKVCYVDDDWVYYVKWTQSDKAEDRDYYDQLWRAPIQKKKSKRTLDVSKEELIFTEKSGIGDGKFDYSWEGFYCDGRYVLYTTNENYTFKKYDLKKGEYVKLSGRKKYDIATLVAVCGKTAFISFSTLGEGMYRMELDSGELIRLTDARGFEEDVAGTEKELFYVERFYYVEGFDVESQTVWQYQIEDGTKQKLIVSSQLKKKLEQENLMDFSKGKEHFYSVADLFVRKNHLYCQVSLTWMEGETHYQDYVIFRVEPGKPGELIYEKELSEVLKNPAENQKVFDKQSWAPGGGPSRENIIYRSRGGVILMTEESAYCVLYNPKEGKNRLGCYDFASGQMKYLTKKDREFARMMYRYGDVLFRGAYQWGCLYFLPNNEELELN